MKRFFIVVPVIMLSVFVACKKAKGPEQANSVQPNNNPDSLVSMNATINGRYWQTDSAFGSYVQHSNNDSGIVDLLITATRLKADSTSTIVFNLTYYTGNGTYPINPPLNTATYYEGNARHFATTGQVVITSDTGSAIIGYFSFVADSIEVDNGAFNVSLP